MKIARITGTVTATIKDNQLGGVKLLVGDIEDGHGKVLEASIVAADTCAAGPGDMVLVTTGSAARMAAGAGGMPVDAVIIAIIDHLDFNGSSAADPSSNRRKQ